MSHTLSVRLTAKVAEWLEETATRMGVSQGRIVREQLERAMENSEPPFMRLAGSVKGPRDLSQRKGFSRK